MSDHEQIRNLVGRYARSLDRGDAGAVVACFLPDAAMSYDGGRLRLTETRELHALLDRTLIAPSTHLIGNFGIELDGDRADVLCSALVVATRETPVLFRGLEYEFACARSPEGWRFSGLAHSVLWQSSIGLK